MATSKGRILCTEDDPDTRELVALVLSDQGYEVVCTDNSNHALELAKTERFDLYLVDTRMPDLSGLGLTRKLREFDAKTPVLFYSASAYESDKEEARLAGAQGYIVKPTENDYLIAEVIRIIAESQIAIPIEIVGPDISSPDGQEGQ